MRIKRRCKFYIAYIFCLRRNMRYFTKKTETDLCTRQYTYKCEHPLYSECTLIRCGDKGLAIVQKRFNPKLKVFWYGPIDSWLADRIMITKGFGSYFDQHGNYEEDGIYPTVSVRQIMWAMKMKPLRKEWWESQEKQFL